MRRQKTITNPEGTLADIDVLVLCGGEGKRLKSVVSDRPKPLAEVGGRPFLDILMENLRGAGFERIILGVGYMKDCIKDRYKKSDVEFSEEETPLGTGGAVKNAEGLIRSKNFLVMNGDSWCDGVDFGALHDFHVKRDALLTMLLARLLIGKDYGTVSLGQDGRILSFKEKIEGPLGHFVNAGIYLMRKEIFDYMPLKPFSLEYDFFPSLVKKGIYGVLARGELLDIGTPERFIKANQMFNPEDWTRLS